jgi:glycine C-acetyltransferase
MENKGANEFNEYCKNVFESGPFSGYKAELHVIHGKQQEVVVADASKKTLTNFCSNNYTGLAADDRIIAAAHRTLDTHGYGLSSAPLMCGFQNIHQDLEKELSKFHGTEDTILYPSGYHTNVGLFAACFGPEDAIFSDELNHSSIIDGTKLSKAKKFVYNHLDVEMLEEQLKNAQDYRFRCIVTEGIFSMDGDILNLPKYVALAKKYNAIFYLDECHSTGVIGKTGRGCVEYWGLKPEDVDLISSTLGKAISGGGGGYTTGRKYMIEYLRQTSKTFIFSNSLCSPIIGASLEALKIFNEDPGIFERIRTKGARFRKGIQKAGFFVYGDDDCPICPVQVKDEHFAKHFEVELFKKGYYTIGLGFPLFPQGQSRLRIIITAKHTEEQVDGLINAFKEVAEEANYFEVMKNYEDKVNEGLVIGNPDWWKPKAKL